MIRLHQTRYKNVEKRLFPGGKKRVAGLKGNDEKSEISFVARGVPPCTEKHLAYLTETPSSCPLNITKILTQLHARLKFQTIPVLNISRKQARFR